MRELLPLLGFAVARAIRRQSLTATEEQPEEYKNWIELGIGGVITSGDRAQFEQEHWLPGDQPYGGIQDLHYEQTFGKDTTLIS